jgi:hypothetical protein
MHLVRDWRRVLSRAYSMWLVYALAALELGKQVIPYISDFLPWWGPVLVILAIPVARVVSQGMEGDR